jgi:PTS system nitrogen regulatory IIA component
MELSEILAEDSVCYFSGVKSKTELLERLADQAGKVLGVDPRAILETLTNRENLGSTGLGSGIAIPHGKLPGLTHVVALFVRLETPIEFDSVDDQPVDLVMALLAPLGAGAEHLKALSRVARLLRTEPIVEDLRREGDPSRLYAILTAAVPSNKAA